MPNEHSRYQHHSTPDTTGQFDDFTRIDLLINDCLEILHEEVCDHLESLGGFRGPVTRRQQRWSRALDRIESERQDLHGGAE